MEKEAVSAGLCETGGMKVPRIQILTAAQIINGECIPQAPRQPPNGSWRACPIRPPTNAIPSARGAFARRAASSTIGASTLNVTLRDVSAGGARIVGEGLASLPCTFELRILEGDGVSSAQRARLLWTDGRTAGLKFIA